MRARKRFGQHFLINAAVIDRLLEAVRVLPNDHIVEIGPGRGALTQPLLLKTEQLDAVEIDRDLVERLRHDFANTALTVHSADALRFPFSSLGNRLRVIGNLPYNISSPLLFQLIEHQAAIQDLHLMLQKEVADRITAIPGQKSYGRLSVMLQYAMHAERLFEVPPDAFDPPPRVQSTLIRLKPKQQRALSRAEEERFSRIVAAAFSQRRKSIRNTLKPFFDGPQLQQMGIDANARAEQLAPAFFCVLARGLAHFTRC